MDMVFVIKFVISGQIKSDGGVEDFTDKKYP